MSIFKKMKEIIDAARKGDSDFDASVFGDDLAMQTEWGPAKGGGTNMGTHKLKEVSPGRLEFKPTLAVYLFSGAFMLVGLAAAIGTTYAGFTEDVRALYFGVPFGVIFFLAGFFVLRSFAKPRVFDQNFGYYWKGKSQLLPNSIELLKEHSQLERIRALQIIRERCTSSSDKGTRTYYSYELNLVLDDATRLNVIDHGKQALMQKDANTLAEFLGVPVWDTSR